MALINPLQSSNRLGPQYGALGGQGGYSANQTGGGRARYLQGTGQGLLSSNPVMDAGGVADTPGLSDTTIPGTDQNPNHPDSTYAPGTPQNPITPNHPVEAPPIPNAPQGSIEYVPGLTPPAAPPAAGGGLAGTSTGTGSSASGFAGRDYPFANQEPAAQGGYPAYAEPPALPQYGGDENAFRTYYGMAPAQNAPTGLQATHNTNYTLVGPNGTYESSNPNSPPPPVGSGNEPSNNGPGLFGSKPSGNYGPIAAPPVPSVGGTASNPAPTGRTASGRGVAVSPVAANTPPTIAPSPGASPYYDLPGNDMGPIAGAGGRSIRGMQTPTATGMDAGPPGYANPAWGRIPGNAPTPTPYMGETANPNPFGAPVLGMNGQPAPVGPNGGIQTSMGIPNIGGPGRAVASPITNAGSPPVLTYGTPSGTTTQNPSGAPQPGQAGGNMGTITTPGPNESTGQAPDSATRAIAEDLLQRAKRR